RRAIYAGARITGCSTASPTKTRTGSIESFWGTLKNELVYHQRFATREQARLAISEYIEIFYNRQRTQARLNYQSPVAFTQRFYLNQIAA
ncbi:IS3 family transposase, partial [Burkholderia cenocepacia]|uniref:IS3 family transposase n=2 Tax=Burkholderia cenocepacia TaxID=95486 RepID=UPI00222FDD99